MESSRGFDRILLATDGTEQADAAVDAAIELARPSSATVRGLVAHSGPVAKAIAEVATNWNADVIVVSSSRMGDLANMFLGSVSHELLRITDRPVLIAERERS